MHAFALTVFVDTDAWPYYGHPDPKTPPYGYFFIAATIIHWLISLVSLALAIPVVFMSIFFGGSPPKDNDWWVGVLGWSGLIWLIWQCTVTGYGLIDWLLD